MRTDCSEPITITLLYPARSLRPAHPLCARSPLPPGRDEISLIRITGISPRIQLELEPRALGPSLLIFPSRSPAYQGSNTSSRTQYSDDQYNRQYQYQSSSSRPITISNGTGGFYTATTTTAADARSSSSMYSGRSSAAHSPGAMARYSPMHATLSQEFSLPLSPGERSGGVSSQQRRGSKDESDAQAYRNAKMAAANLPPYLRPDYGDGYLRLDTDGVVKSGTLEALVERLTVDPLST